MGERRHGEYWEGCWARYGGRVFFFGGQAFLIVVVEGER